MDYESLFLILPKEPKKWTISDVGIWLSFIGLPNLTDIFGKFTYGDNRSEKYSP